MKRRKLKPIVKVVSVLLVVSITMIFALSRISTEPVQENFDKYVYVNEYIFDTYYPVINQDDKIIKPYTSDKVVVDKSFYEKEADKSVQEKSIIFYDGIYMQNSGVTYKSDEEFEVNTILEGTVSNVSEDTLLGKTIEVRYSNELMVVYQSLNDIKVKKGDVLNQGQIIGKSGSCSLTGDSKYNLHIEIYKNGSVVNPESFYDKTIKEISEN